MEKLLEAKGASTSDFQEIQSFLMAFLAEYASAQKEMPVGEWIYEQLCKHFPDAAPDELAESRDNIQASVESISDAMESVEKTAEKGLCAEEWLYQELKKHEGEGDLPSDAVMLSLNREMESVYRDWMTQIEDNAALRQSATKLERGELNRMASDGFKKTAMSTYQKEMGLSLNETEMSSMLVRGDLFMRVAHNAAAMGIASVVLNMGMFLISKAVWQKNGEIEEKLMRQTGIVGVTASLRSVCTAGLQIGIERGLLPLLKKGTSVTALATISITAIESGKMLMQWSKGEIGAWEFADKAARISVATFCASILALEGATIGAGVAPAAFTITPEVVLSVGGVVGCFIGNVIGGTSGTISYNLVKKLIFIMQEVAHGNYHCIELAENREAMLQNYHMMKYSMELRTAQVMNRLGY